VRYKAPRKEGNMAKMNLTKLRIEALPIPAAATVGGFARDYYHDERAAGLVLCITSTGSKTFEFYKRVAGRPTRVKIGHFPDLSVEQARNAAARLAGEIAQGGNPAAKRRQARGETTLQELFDHYLEAHAKPHKRTWEEDVRQFELHLSGLRNRKLSQIRQADIQALHARAARERVQTTEVKGKTRRRTIGGPYGANRLLALVSVLFSHAASIGYEGPNPAKGIRRFKEQSRDRFLHADELGAFFTALNAEPDPWKDFFLVTLLSGARRSNVQSMRWADLELNRGLWRIPEADSKNKEPMICILVRPVVETLQQRSAAGGDRSEWVFSSCGASGHIAEPKKAWARILERASIKNLRMHDLRRTLGSWQAATGASLSIIGRALGHKNVATTAIYARLDMDPIRQSVETATAAILGAAGLPLGLPAADESDGQGGSNP
jgi:integrase